mmetsp:Transcript_75970/g.246033  ORF Transcript_75970/g.246033 Transcript_75970/m.246033 type:complete len:488 (-) Transcript_75970:81-1544(-)
MDGQLTVGGYLRTRWTDPRLRYNASSFPRGVNLRDYKPEAYIWTPDLFIENLVQSVFGGGAGLLRIDPDGQVYRSAEVLWRVTCDMGFSKLPFDEQHCAVTLASFAHPASHLRVTAFGGAVGGGLSGEGILGEAMQLPVWDIGGGGGYTTPGRVEVRERRRTPGWDYLHLDFSFKRKAKFFVQQFLIPDLLFLGVSYTGFYIDPEISPARAMVAIIPLLIMLTLLNNLFDILPKTPDRMWLTDYLRISLFYSAFTAVEFAFVQLLLNREHKRAANLKQLNEVKAEAVALVRGAAVRKMTVMELLTRYSVTDVVVQDDHKLRKSKSSLSALFGSPGQELRRRKRSTAAEEAGVTEANLGVIEYARNIFAKYDRDSSDSLSCGEIRKVLSFFNIYLTDRSCATVMCMFMRDKGETTPKDESLVQMQFGIFLELLIEVRKYLLKVSRHSSFIAHFKSSPPSSRLDMTCRILFPSMVIIKMLVMLFTIFRY